MTESILVGRGRDIVSQSTVPWRRELEAAASTRSPRLAFMTREHHAVRDTAVAELSRAAQPLPPHAIAERTNLPVARVETLLDELERGLFFLVRDPRGHVSWAFPFTSEPTPHRLVFSTGESTYAS